MTFPSRFSMTGRFFLAAIAFLPTTTVLAVPQCTALGFNNFPQGKGNKLYLFFPATATAYPQFGPVGTPTNPAQPFDVSRLQSYTGVGTAEDLRSAIVDVVTDTYCEFNVEVVATSTLPSSALPRRNVVAIGTDAARDFGYAQRNDTNDEEPVDFSRVWAGTYQEASGRPGGALYGAKSTLERWSQSIGNTAAHEAGHNYGLLHSDALVPPRTGAVDKRHLMTDGTQFNDEERAERRRFLGDYEYSLLASNVGLSVQTLMNWTFVNPNQETATALKLEVLSPQSALTVASVFTTSTSPWINPIVSSSLGLGTHQGSSYQRFEVTWSTGQPWDGGPSGEVPGGASFEVGISFNAVDPLTRDPVIVRKVRLLRGGVELPLRPRVPGFDAGTISRSGTLSIGVANLQRDPFEIEDASVTFLPRLAGVQSMGALKAPGLEDIFRREIIPFERRAVAFARTRILENAAASLQIAQLGDMRHIVSVVDPALCEREDTSQPGGDTGECRQGIRVSLFPATSTLLSVSVVDRNARQWDPRERKYVNAPLRTSVRHQFVGWKPDFDRNGVDDAIDIMLRPARDRDRNGVLDDVRGNHR